MADSELTPAQVILLAVKKATDADIKALRALVYQYRRTLHLVLTLRILLTYLPETLESSEYAGFLEVLSSGTNSSEENAPIDTSDLDSISPGDAIKKVKKLHLLPLKWPSASEDTPEDPLILFLIHRAYRIDEATGLLTQLPVLLAPFLHHSSYLRTWMITTILPLLRLNYEYYPEEDATQTITSFEALDDRAGVELLLSRTALGEEDENGSRKRVGRDLRGLVGPWLYGDTRWKRRKITMGSGMEAQTVQDLDNTESPPDDRSSGWNEVFRWLVSQSSSSWPTAVEAIEQWDGPSDVDLGAYGDGGSGLEEDERKLLEKQYARAALGAAYSIQEHSLEALEGIQRILRRLTILLDYERIPTLSAAGALLKPVTAAIDSNVANVRNASFLRSSFMDERNVLTTPSEVSISFFQGLLVSAYLLSRAGVTCTIRHAGELALFQDESDQLAQARRLIQTMSNGPKGDDKYWIRMRNEILWLRDWGVEELTTESGNSRGRGVFGKVDRDFLETEILKQLLANTRYTLARSIYEQSEDRPLTKAQVQDTVIAAAMNAYDNATNANKTRGGVKKCHEIINAFPDTIAGSLPKERIQHLLNATHSIGTYRLVLKQGEPFTPVNLRVHPDPISIIAKILDQNSKVYTKIQELYGIGEEMVRAGLTVRDVEGRSIITADQIKSQLTTMKKRVTSMCIDAALADDDFETAYSLVMTRLSSVASEAQTRAQQLGPADRRGSGILAQPPPKKLDDWSWRAALQAGKYRFNANTTRPTHIGNASGNLVVRHLEQRKDCLSLALRIAPPSTLQEILNAFRRCEEELETKIREEAEQEAAWDQQGDDTLMPGGFGSDRPAKPTRATNALPIDEAPMSLFELTRASAAKAQNVFGGITALRGGIAPGGSGRGIAAQAREGSAEQLAGHRGVRKRDQLRNAAVGTLASGIGWLINAPVPPSQE